MKIKIFKEKYEQQVKKEPKNKKKTDKKWVLKITLLAFIISCVLSLISELIIPNVYILISIILILIFILMGIIFDIIGVAVTTAEEKIFNSMATKKVRGAKTAVKLIKKKEKVSSFCNDVIGDICGVISGSCGLSVTIKLVELFDFDLLITTIILTSLISALTIGGKALGKSYAVNKSNDILFKISKLITPFKEK